MMWYNKAIECADTLSKKCDYVTLFSIYGQKAEVYSRQYLHREAINAYFIIVIMQLVSMTRKTIFWVLLIEFLNIML